MHIAAQMRLVLCRPYKPCACLPMLAEDASTLQMMRKEIGIMRAISCDQHIVQFYGACTTTEPAMLVMEYMRVRYN